MLCAVAHGCLILPETLLKGLKRLCTGLADLTDDWVGGRALRDAHLKVMTVPLPRLRLGCHTLAILLQLSAAVAGSDLQGRLHLEAEAEGGSMGKERSAFSGIRLSWRRPAKPSLFRFFRLQSGLAGPLPLGPICHGGVDTWHLGQLGPRMGGAPEMVPPFLRT